MFVETLKGVHFMLKWVTRLMKDAVDNVELLLERVCFLLGR